MDYQGSIVKSIEINIESEIDLNIKVAWSKVNTSKLLQYVTKGMVTFEPVNTIFPTCWKENESVQTKMKLFGFLPFGGVHTIYFESIDSQTYTIKTTESNSIIKVWNHTINISYLENNKIKYSDNIIIYARILTPIIALWAKYFYIYRQNNWQKLALSMKD